MVNYLAVVVAAIATHVLGFLWYGPLFGKKWMQLMKLTDKDKEKAKQKGMAKVMVGSFVASLVTAGVLAFLIDQLVVNLAEGNALGGSLIGALVWLGFVATKALGSVFWEGKSWKLYFLNTAHDLVSLLLMGAILGAWA